MIISLHLGKVSIVNEDETSTMGVVKFTVDSGGRFTYVDENFTKLIGYSEDEVTRKDS
jgi:PAS domain S-box-containing protein